MATKVKNNLGAIRSLNTLNKNARAAQKNLRKVSTGERINSAADDASAYGISERMREKIRSLNQANDNAQNDMAMMRTAEGAVANIVDILRTLKQKAIDSANDSNTDADRRIMQKEVDQLLDQIDDNALVTFNGKGLVNGQMSGVSRIIGAIWYCDGLYSSDLGDPNLTPRLTELKKRGTDIYTPGESLGIEESDTYTVTHVIGGKTYSTSSPVNNVTLTQVTWGYKLRDDIVQGQLYYGSANVEATASASNSWGPVPVYDNRYVPLRYSGGTGIIVFDDEHSVANVEMKVGTLEKIMLNNKGEPIFLSDDMVGDYIIQSIHKDYQLAGFNITIRDEGGNIKEEASRALQFKLLQRSEGPSDGTNGVGGFTTAATFHVGAGANQSMTVSLSDMRASAFGLKSKDGTQTVSIKTRDDALAALSAFDNAIEGALDQITSIGALEARLEYTIGNITTSAENVQASDSTIRDADMAKEMTAYTRDNILTQTAQAMLAQANQDASSILGLLS